MRGPEQSARASVRPSYCAHGTLHRRTIWSDVFGTAGRSASISGRLASTEAA